MNFIYEIANLITENPGETDIINFAELKHHLGSMVLRLREIETAQQGDSNSLSQPFFDIGTGTTDVYIGRLTSEMIKREINEYFGNNNINSKRSLELNLSNTGQDGRLSYKIISLSDGSKWVLAPSQSIQWAHIHPAKVSQHVTRFRNQILKQALLTYAVSLTKKSDPFKLVNLNYVRSKLGMEALDVMPPMIGKLLNLINHRI